MKPDIKLVVFDIDGTLVDSQAMIIACLQKTCQDLNIEAPTSRAQLLSGVGLPLPLAVQKAIPHIQPGEVPPFVERFRLHQKELMHEVERLQPLFPGVMDMLKTLRRNGCKLSVLTSKAKVGLDVLLDAHQLRPLFVSIKTPEDGPAKPDPFLLLRCMDEAGATAAETVFVGDSTYDVETAIAANSNALGVSWGYHTEAQLAAVGAQRIIHSVADIAPTIAAWNK